MVLASFNKVKKYFGDRLILDIDKLEILESDRIGLVGENGAGKTTLTVRRWKFPDGGQPAR